eukprot:5123817-Amphidinium_carterae.1
MVFAETGHVTNAGFGFFDTTRTPYGAPPSSPQHFARFARYHSVAVHATTHKDLMDLASRKASST